MFANVVATFVLMTHLSVLCNSTQDEEEEGKEGKTSSVVLKYLFQKIRSFDKKKTG